MKFLHFFSEYFRNWRNSFETNQEDHYFDLHIKELNCLHCLQCSFWSENFNHNCDQSVDSFSINLYVNAFSFVWLYNQHNEKKNPRECARVLATNNHFCREPKWLLNDFLSFPKMYSVCVSKLSRFARLGLFHRFRLRCSFEAAFFKGGHLLKRKNPLDNLSKTLI